MVAALSAVRETRSAPSSPCLLSFLEASFSLLRKVFGGVVTYGGVAKLSTVRRAPLNRAKQNFKPWNTDRGGPCLGSGFNDAHSSTAEFQSPKPHGPTGSVSLFVCFKDSNDASHSSNVFRSLRSTAARICAVRVFEANIARAFSIRRFATNRSPCTTSKLLVMANRSVCVVVFVTPACFAASVSWLSSTCAACSARSSSANASSFSANATETDSSASSTAAAAAVAAAWASSISRFINSSSASGAPSTHLIILCFNSIKPRGLFS
mmetsp:Transcript_11412/g.42296  ORF Transcript_11412/g.42296 Transcript_11412/m.42296 type:complete len:266 (-) Transcript_11412:3307-4104(-)